MKMKFLFVLFLLVAILAAPAHAQSDTETITHAGITVEYPADWYATPSEEFESITISSVPYEETPDQNEEAAFTEDIVTITIGTFANYAALIETDDITIDLTATASDPLAFTLYWSGYLNGLSIITGMFSGADIYTAITDFGYLDLDNGQWAYTESRNFDNDMVLLANESWFVWVEAGALDLHRDTITQIVNSITAEE